MVLHHVKSGANCTIKDFSRINSWVRKRLLDIGIMEGMTVKVNYKMPFHGPIVIENNHQSIAIRYSDAGRIQVEG